MSTTSFFRIPAMMKLALLSHLALAAAHMEMSWPYPLRSKYNPATPENLIDYSMTSPLDPSGDNYPCKLYNTNTPSAPVVTYTPGQTYNATFAGSASHGGGSCQLSLSYDNGTSFHVVESIEGGCMLNTTYDFTIPTSAPAGTALFGWTWFNLIGNREMYMNCAVVTIAGSSPSRVKRHLRRDDAFDALPLIYLANIGSKGSYTTVEGDPVVFPEPGDQVVFGLSVDASSPVDPGVPNGGSASASAGSSASATPVSAASSASAAPVSASSESSAAASSLSPSSSISAVAISSALPTTLTTSTPPSAATPSSLVVVSVSFPNATSASPASAPSASGTTTCSPGAIQCLSASEWAMCSGAGDAYINMGAVAAGMACVGGAYVPASGRV